MHILKIWKKIVIIIIIFITCTIITLTSKEDFYDAWFWFREKILNIAYYSIITTT